MDLRREQSRWVSEISEVLDVEDNVATALLRFFKWNKERLLERASAQTLNPPLFLFHFLFFFHFFFLSLSLTLQLHLH